MQHFMSEEEAIAVIEKNIEQIEAWMVSGTDSGSGEYDSGSTYIGDGGNPCSTDPGQIALGCGCCMCA